MRLLGLFRFDNLSIFVGIFIVFFTLLIVIYSFSFMRKTKGVLSYYLYIILTLIASLGAVFSNNLWLFILFWGFLGLTLYLLIGFGEKENTPATAKKAFIIIGGTDALMLLGIVLIWQLAGSLEMDKIRIALDTKSAVFAYLCLAAAAFAKAGAMPLHTWVPDTAEDAPTPVTAYLPASLDKLLGIYFLARISLDIFVMDKAMNTFLMAIGSFTIIAAVMMALIQHDLKRLLGYHAVSQVGYMVLGIGTGIPIGIAGGLFHMLNHAIYKCCLFLSGGAVEKKAHTTDLERLGGYAKVMPVSFAAFLIASLAISGVPPFNGFVSKWMVYQGIIETAKNWGCLWIIWLLAAIFGSALTLASFMKLVHTVFLGQPSDEIPSYAKASEDRRDTNFTMLLPAVILAALCVIFGVFAYQIPLKFFISPSIRADIAFSGLWHASLATILIFAGIIFGVIIYYLGTAAKARYADAFVGGEILNEHPHMRVSGREFFDTIRETGPLKKIYGLAEKKRFDIYEQAKELILGFGRFLQYLHNGILPTYLVWALLGMLWLYIILLR